MRDRCGDYEVSSPQGSARPACKADNEELWIFDVVNGPIRRGLRAEMTDAACDGHELGAGPSIVEIAGECPKSVRCGDFACIPGLKDARNFFFKGSEYQQHPYAPRRNAENNAKRTPVAQRSSG